MEIAARFQLNLLVTPIPRFNLYKNVPRRFMPVLWFEQHVTASENQATIVKLLLAAPTAGQIFGLTFVIIGITLMLAACIFVRDECELNYDVKTEFEKTKLPESLPLLVVSMTQTNQAVE